MNPIKTAVIPAAGLGTRFLPATKMVPKELLPVVDKPSLEWVVEELLEAGIEKVVFVLHPRKRMILDHFQKASQLEEALEVNNRTELLKKIRRFEGRIQFEVVHQMEAKGLGHAILQAKNVVEEEYFCVVLPDDLVKSKVSCVKQMCDAHQKFKQSIIALEQIEKERSSLYGMVGGTALDDQHLQIDKLVEKPQPQEAPSDQAIIGRYILHKDVFKHIEATQSGALGEIQLTDALSKLCEEKGIVGYSFEGQRLDTGQPHGFIHANVVYGLDSDVYGEKLKVLLSAVI